MLLHRILTWPSRNLTILTIAPAAPQILEEFRSANEFYETLLVSIWNLGTMFGPLLIGPLTELYGRMVVYNTANILFILCCIAGAESQSIGMLIAFRFLNGFTIASTTLNPSIVGDMFVLEQRGRAQSILQVMPLVGPVCGPIVGGFLSQDKGWRWTYWLAVILVGAAELGILLLYRETYEPKLVRSKVARLRKQTGNPAYHSKHDRREPTSQLFKKAMLTPFRVFIMPIFVVLASAVALIFGYIFCTVTTLTEVFEIQYGFSEGTSGLCFLGLGVGMAIGVFVCGATLDWYTAKQKKLHHGEVKPEWRLPLMALGGMIVPIGLFLYGWTAQFHVHFMAPIVGTALLGFGIDAITIPAITYLGDIFTVYRASAMASMTVTRAFISTVLPLAAPPLYAHLGLGWGNSIFGFIALATIPIPFMLIKYGERIRKRSNL